MRAALARAAAQFLSRDRADLARRQLCDRLLPARPAAALDDRDGRGVAGLSPGIFRAAASELAHRRMAAGQSVVRGGSATRAAQPGPQSTGSLGPQSEVSIRSMSSSLNP